MNNTLAALIIALAILGHNWLPWVFGYSQMEHDAAELICEDHLGRMLAEHLTVSERISTLVLATCRPVED